MLWIAVEGIDGSGKTSVGRWIQEHYEAEGRRVLVQVHPSDRLLGRGARRALQSSGPLMYAVSIALYMLDILGSLRRMRRWRQEYDAVVFVRYLMAAAYLPRRYAQLTYRFVSRLLPPPDRMLLVDIEPTLAVHRIAQRDDRMEMFENLPSLTMVRETELWLARDEWSVIDNSGSEAETRAKLDAILYRWERGWSGLM